jgi:hypothetical protein
VNDPPDMPYQSLSHPSGEQKKGGHDNQVQAYEESNKKNKKKRKSGNGRFLKYVPVQFAFDFIQGLVRN